jgi:tripartite-type tricarboxylate transporter receptor subunit TctC
LQDELKGAFVVENKPGATSNIASETVAAAQPDGYTLLLAAAPLTMNKFVFPKQKFDPLKSFEPISKISSAPGVLAVSPKMPVKTYKEFEELAKNKPNALSYGTTGAGGTQHMATLRLEQLTGIDMLHVPYSGGSGVLNDLIAGVVDSAFMTSTGAMPNLQAGKVIPLAIAGPVRLPGLPQVPTFAELGLPGMVSDSWNGLLAPAGTPQPVIDQLARAIAKAVQSKEFKDTLIPQGAVLIGNSPGEFKSQLQAEVVHWAEQFKKVKLD